MRTALTLLALCAACSQSEPDRIEVAQFPAVESRALDLLFLIDDSGSTAEWQFNFAAAMPTFLANLADGGPLPDLHIGIVTPDMGTTASQTPDNPPLRSAASATVAARTPATVACSSRCSSMSTPPHWRCN